jgi:hypothetical protein
VVDQSPRAAEPQAVENINVKTTPNNNVVVTAKGTVSESYNREVEKYNLL